MYFAQSFKRIPRSSNNNKSTALAVLFVLTKKNEKEFPSRFKLFYFVVLNATDFDVLNAILFAL